MARPALALPHGATGRLISALFIGDSTTVGYGGTDPVPIFQADMLSDWGITVVATNQGINGTATPSWVPGSTLTAAMAAGKALTPPATYAYLMLGINDSAVSAGPISPTTYLSNMASTCAALVAGGYTVMIDQCLYVPNTVPGWDSSSVTAMAGYIAGLPGLANGTTIRTNDQQAYAWAQANHGTTYFNANDVHPHAAGYAVMAGFWASAWPGT